MAKQRNNQSRRGRPTGRNRHISIRSARRAEPDLKKIAQAVVSLALAQAEAEAQAQAREAGQRTLTAPQNAEQSAAEATEAEDV